ncbi:hypothetical protein PFICI_04479 [Pestalotiopsis fici W106-1]|uniref:N-acetyltransferase domain-containing protein n=1 Tax=Pestalotiopsis fici (strain W106-1 / CGMCC3.15140) TaxID=1229662 RepID=W3X902_PESFW|nr:uncharacterized protein PFICI_04479 [Pestalotiopsis fici W106-1]ETS82603.1 hypothetical protein PFICI_04479 [Pestalotiopsis fici W106-1]
MALPFPVPASLAPGFVLSRCTPADVPQMVTAYSAAFLQTNFTYWWPVDLEVMRRWTEARFRLRFRNPSDQHFKVADVATGQIVAWARWTVPVEMKGLAVGFRTFDDDDDNNFLDNNNGSVQGVTPEQQWMQNPPAGSDEELYHEFFAGIKAMSKKWESHTKLALQLLCTDPAYHRRGLAAALLDCVLEVADRQGITTYVEALENAVPVYQRYGFKTVDTLGYDLTRTGREETVSIEIMLREPRTLVQ